MPILVVSSRYTDEEIITTFLEKLFGEHSIQISVRRGRFLITVPRVLEDAELKELREATKDDAVTNVVNTSRE